MSLGETAQRADPEPNAAHCTDTVISTSVGPARPSGALSSMFENAKSNWT